MDRTIYYVFSIANSVPLCKKVKKVLFGWYYGGFKEKETVLEQDEVTLKCQLPIYWQLFGRFIAVQSCVCSLHWVFRIK